MSEQTHRAKHEAYVAAYIRRNFQDQESRGYVREGLGDAAHLCDAIAADLEATGRSSKRRAELVALAKACGDAIWQMREGIGMSNSPTHQPTTEGGGRADPR